MDLVEIQRHVRAFRDARKWLQFHNPKNLAISVSLEAADLLEHFQWRTFEEFTTHLSEAKAEISDEIAAIAIYLIDFCDIVTIDLEAAVNDKLDRNAAKHLIDRAKGLAKKYDKL
jgi:dCTP diphosphatase